MNKFFDRITHLLPTCIVKHPFLNQMFRIRHFPSSYEKEDALKTIISHLSTSTVKFIT